MPVVMTMTAIALLSGSGSGGRDETVGFFNPDSLRDQIRARLPRGETRMRALAVAEEIERLKELFFEAVEATIEAFRESTADPTSSVEAILESIEPLDTARAQTLSAILLQRESLIRILTQEEWDQLFD